MNPRTTVPTLAALAITTTTIAQPAASQRQVYLDLARVAYDDAAARCPEHVENWIKRQAKQESWGYYDGPGGPVWVAGLAASLYELTGEERYAAEAVQWLSRQQRFKEYYPESARREHPEYNDGLPTMTNFFHLTVFAEGYTRIKDSPPVTTEQRRRMEQSIAESADFMFKFPEWGPMNRAMLRAEGLAWAARALPDHPRAAAWRKMAGVLASDSWGRWEEEDAQIYHPVWLYSLIRYADVIGDHSIYEKLTTRFYFEYFLRLMAPKGSLPEFGDARWNANQGLYLVCFERGATEYRNGEYKWAAARLLEALKQDRGARVGSWAGLALSDAYRWADDGIRPKQPTNGSAEVLEDLVGKKIVFRSGWEPDSTYLALNYRDEGDYALVPRDFLRNTIPVEEEKMHHGHSDENSIVMLMNQGSVLLHDGGYRDRIPSGDYGAYRADYFHNRLVARTMKPGRKQPLFEFLRGSGAYRPVRTQKIDFFTLADADVSRTRLTDARTGYESDRVIVYLKRDDVFIVFDIVKILKADYYTFATLWHATDVLEQGAHYYVTTVDQVAGRELPRRRALLIDFLQHGTRSDGTFPVERNRQKEVAVYQAISSHYPAGRIETFVTVLVPHERGGPLEPYLERFRLLKTEKPRAGVGVEIKLGDKVQYVCVKTDLTAEILTGNFRPRYTFDSGRVKYGPLETDASFLHARRSGDRLSYSAANMVKIVYDGREVFAAQPSTFAAQPDDLSTGYGPPKWRYWEDVVELR